MRQRRWLVPVAEVAVGLTVAATILLASTGALSTLAAFGLLLASAAPLYDLVDMLVRLRLRYAVSEEAAIGVGAGSQNPGPPPELAVVASVYNAEAEIPDFLEASRPYRTRLWIIDDASSDQTVDILRSRGVRCLRSDRNLHKPAALKRLLSRLPDSVDVVVVLDPDTRLRAAGGGRPPIEAVAEDMRRRGYAAVCPRVTVRRDNLLASLQAIEYALAVALGRAALGRASVTSGISLYRRSDLEAALSEHSLSVYAEDLENTLMLLAAGKSIVLDERIVAETEGKTTLKGLFSQRIGWAYGHIRVYWERRAELLQVLRRSPVTFYQYGIYLGLVGIVMHPIRQVGALLVGTSLLGTLGLLFGVPFLPQTGLAHPALFATVCGQYGLLGLLAVLTTVPPGERWRAVPLVPLFPVYALLLTVPVSIGFLNWITVRLFGRRIVSDHYAETSRLLDARPRTVRRPLPGAAAA